MTHIITAHQALTDAGWENNVRVTIDGARIASVESNGADSNPPDRATGQRPGSDMQYTHVDVLLPAQSNLHSHAFQRAMAGLTEQRGPDPRDSFWTWRKLMYRFLDQLNPDDIEGIAAFVYLQMIEAGYCAVGEFHYLHHQPGGQPYSHLAEMSERIASAAQATGIGLTLLPVLYQYGGCDERPLGHGQVRFGNDPDRFAQLMGATQSIMSNLPEDCRLGVAPHSLRAVNPDGLKTAIELADGRVVHMHLAEQVAEVEEVEQYLKATPGEWLLDNADVNESWCLIHGTQLTEREIARLAQRHCVIGLCPVTESSLGDGIFDARTLCDNRGLFGIGSDSNIRIGVTEELRLLEFSQRLRDKERAVLATSDRSTGHVLYSTAARGSAQAVARNSGVIAPGKLADLVSLDTAHIDLFEKIGDALMDSYVFAASDCCVNNVWSAGRHILNKGRHAEADSITARYRQILQKLLSA